MGIEFWLNLTYLVGILIAFIIMSYIAYDMTVDDNDRGLMGLGMFLAGVLALVWPVVLFTWIGGHISLFVLERTLFRLFRWWKSR